MLRETVSVLLFAISTAVSADDSLAGKNLVTPPTGQPFCEDRDELQEYILAALKNDTTWLKSLKSCATVKAGLKVAVIEEYEGSDLGHVVKVRVFGGRGSMVGYTLSLGLQEK